MTEQLQLLAMLNRAGIKHAIEVHSPTGEVHPAPGVVIKGPCVEITVEGGYSGFSSVFFFDADGNLVYVGAFE